MYENMLVFMDGSTTPVVVEPLTVDVWAYNELADKAKAKLSMAPMQLTIAYCQLVDPEPKTLEVIRKWAREHRVTIEVAETVDPTQSEASDA
ncbi:hypothetical protein UFOVP1504_21 [uncultured Caudovirales phage]|uniref:Tail assembly chaperone n=1 Tax=uncultured Caudovirales phage TaxID=2100421 RepID=A0A6J5SP05_9CAUD|nr:hypothetical protein UFOVP1143_3 [uncultured Caudovirales phage]CAB4217242.1 hypothetical protein UFOVP1504_21 [uncultured Caudovirales phage]